MFLSLKSYLIPFMALRTLATHLRRIPETARELILGSILLIVSIMGAVAFGRIVEHIPLFVAFDTFWYEKINMGLHPAWLDMLVSPFNFNFLPWGGIFIPSFLFFVFGFSLIYIGIRHRQELLWAIISLLAAIAIDTILFKITNAYVFRDRPFQHLSNNLTENAKAIWRNWPTYPSGHVRDTALYSTVLVGYAHELRWPFALFTLWIVFTRVYLGAHYPTDALAGWALGYLVGIAILLLLKPLRAHFLRGRAERKQKGASTTAV